MPKDPFKHLRLSLKRQRDEHRRWWFDPQFILLVAYCVTVVIVFSELIMEGR